MGKKIILLCVSLCMLITLFISGNPMNASAAPAPSLSSVQITDLTVDDNNEIHAEIRVIGTGKSFVCWGNNSLLKRNYNEEYDLVNPSTNIVYGTVMYYHTGLYYSPENYGKTITIKFQAINAMNPWNTLSTSRTFTIPTP